MCGEYLPVPCGPGSLKLKGIKTARNTNQGLGQFGNDFATGTSTDDFFKKKNQCRKTEAYQSMKLTLVSIR